MQNNHISRTATITLNATPDKILPLFTAYGETLWVSGWNPEYIYPEDGEAKENSVWKTKHGDDDPETIWVTISYDRGAHSVTHLNITPDRQVTRIDIRCAATDEGKTRAQITYTITAIGEKGQNYINQLSQAHYDHWMLAWEKGLNDYLLHGQVAAHPD